MITGRASRFGRPLAFTLIGFVLVAALGSAGAFFFEAPSAAGMARAALDIGYVGVMSSAFAFLLLILALQHLPPAEAAIIVSTETLFSASAAYLFLGERLAPLGWAGAALILAASLLVQVAPTLSSGARLLPRACTGPLVRRRGSSARAMLRASPREQRHGGGQEHEHEVDR